MVNFGLQAAEIGPVVWGTPANFNGFRVLAALLHGRSDVSIDANVALAKQKQTKWCLFSTEDLALIKVLRQKT